MIGTKTLSTCVVGATIALLLISSVSPSNACTNLLVSRGASADGSTFITYAADAHNFYGDVAVQPARVHPPGAMRDIHEWDGGTFLGRIPQPERTYHTVGLMNEHQVAVAETTFGGREELEEGNGILDYGSLMFIAVERSRTAREAIQVITDLVAEFGYKSAGESISISDPNEVWILEIISKGPEETGAVWVARRVPDGYISGHANQARIRQFPLNEPESTVYSPDVIEFARKHGFFEGPDEEFSFADAYAPLDWGALRFCEARVWSLFRRAAPSLDLPAEMVSGESAVLRLPLWVKPDEPLTVADAIALMRDHFEGTKFDMTKDVGAGPFACPYRWRPLTWELDEVKYGNERAISTQQTGFSFVAQSRGSLPDPIGGILWFGVDDTFSTVYVPLYCSIAEPPPSFAPGVASLLDFSWDSAFWVFNWVSNYAYSRYSDMIVDIQQVQQALEGEFQARQPDVEAAALALFEKSPELAREYLTRYSVDQGESTVKRWRRLGETLLVKYMDGNVKDEFGNPDHPPYPDHWYRRIVDETGELFKEVEVERGEEIEN